ncbi:MAG: hypothetical protein K0S76_587 [Herbinix sp.]|jgi:O-antigen/teichoic acid export membrane protein|nr:hypothetical protein [Herbinix sp.]
MRLENTVRNTKYAIVGQAMAVAASFLNRTIFIHFLSVEYLGVNGLFSNILSILSLAELGVGSAIIYNMYKPLATNDISKVKKLMNFYKMAYNVIGVFVLITGLSLLPFLEFFINNKPDINHLHLIYVLYVMNSSASYFFTYKRSIIFADQKNYIDSINLYQQTIVQSIVQNTVLIVTGNIILYYIVQIVTIVFFNYKISKKANKLYPFLISNKEKLEKSERMKILKDVSALLMHRIGFVVVCSTDNFLIAKFVSLAAVGLYSNYIMIVSAVKGIIVQLINGVTASIGHLNAVETSEKSYDIYKKIYFINAWLVGFCSIAFYVLLNPFIELWVGKKYLLSPEIVLIISINFYLCDIRGIRSVTNTFKDTMGLFWQDRFKPAFEAVINLVASVILLKLFGFIGVLLGTLISTIVTDLWVEPYIVFKYGFKKRLYHYFFIFFKFGAITLLSGFITKFICSRMPGSLIFTFVTSIIIVTVIPNLLFIVIFHKADEFQYIYRLAMKKVRSLKTRKAMIQERREM